jgi:hypothetical protein
MFGKLEARPLADTALTFFDNFIHEFLDPAALKTHDVIVVAPLPQLKHGMPAFEMMPRHQASGLELGQNPVDGGQAHVLAGIEQRPVNILGAEVPVDSMLQDLQDTDPG